MSSATQELKNSIQTKLEQSGEYDRCVQFCRTKATPCPAHNLRLLRGTFSAATCAGSRSIWRQKLIESGWRDDLKKYTMGAPTSLDMRSYHHAPHTACFLLHSILLSCDSLIFRTASAELIRSKGDTTMTVEQLTAEIIPRGRGACPPNWPRFAP